MRPVFSIIAAGLALSVAPAAIAQGDLSPQDSVSLSSTAPMTLDDFVQALRAATGRPVLVGLTPDRAYLRKDRGHLVRVNWNGNLATLLNGVAPRYGVKWAQENGSILLFDEDTARPKVPPPPPAVKVVDVPASVKEPAAASIPLVQNTAPPASLPAAPSVIAPAPIAAPAPAAPLLAAAPVYAAPPPAPIYAAPAPAPTPAYVQPVPAYAPPAPLRRYSDAGLPPVVTSNRPDAPAPRPFVDTPPRTKRQGGMVNLVSTERSSLDAKEAYGVELANEWKSNPDKPRQGEDGSVKYLYGATMPTLVCSPLEVCAIQLQPGETVNDVHAGDTARWRITPANSGKDASATTLVIVKPTDAGLTTNLFISTDRRTYSIKLVSTQKSWIPVLSFDYPDDVQREWASFRQQQEKQAVATTIPSTGQNITNLDFNYRITGDRPRWQPQRVYSDGVKTYIQFPSSNFNDEAPALVALGRDGGLFAEASPEMVNYRVVGDLYVVDQVIDRAALIAGVGREQSRVLIEHKGR